MDIVRYIIETFDIDIDQADGYLCKTCCGKEHGNLEMLKFLLDQAERKYGSVDSKIWHKVCIDYSKRYCHYDILEYLLKNES